jgi:hypothetical protein
MRKVVLDEILRAKLNGLEEQVELCDETGRTVGHILPEDVYQELVYAWADTPITSEELERRQRESRAGS